MPLCVHVALMLETSDIDAYRWKAKVAEQQGKEAPHLNLAAGSMQCSDSSIICWLL